MWDSTMGPVFVTAKGDSMESFEYREGILHIGVRFFNPKNYYIEDMGDTIVFYPITGGTGFTMAGKTATDFRSWWTSLAPPEKVS